MDCMECGAPIPPAFKAAILKNECPGCGGNIMSDDAVSLMKELKEAMAQMPNDPEGLAGWLLSNYRMVKVGDGEPTGFYGKPAGVSGDEVRKNLKIAPNKLQQFMKNAGVNPKQVSPEMKAHYKALISEIDGESLDDEQDVYDSEDFVAEEEFPEFTKKALGAMTDFSKGKKPRGLQSSVATDDGSDGTADLPPALQEDRMDRLEKQQRLESLGSVGKISRSG